MKRNLLAWAPLYAGAGVFLCFLPIVRSNLVTGSLVLGGIIAAFAYFGYNDSRSDRREVADNSYLLGFLFTLAMIVATLQDVREADLREISGELINAIGIAMATSVIGMVMRIVILDRHVEPPDQLAQEFKEVVRRLQDLANSMDESKDATDTYRGDLARLSEATQSYRAGLESEANQLGELLDMHTAKVADRLAEKLAASLNLGELAELRNELLKSARDIAPVTRSLADNIRLLGESADRLQLNFSSSYASELASRLETISRSLADAESAIGRMANAAQQALADLQNIGNDLVFASRDNLGKIRKQAEADLDAIAGLKDRYRTEYERAAQEALRETHKLYAALIAGADSVLSAGDRAGTVAQDIRRIADQLERQAASARG